MAFFKDPAVERKYVNATPGGDADPMIHVNIPYNGRYSEIPMVIADEIFSRKGQIALKTEQDRGKDKPKEK